MFKFNFGDVIWGLVGLFRCLLQKTCSVRHSCVCVVASDPSCTVQCSQQSSGTSGSGGWYPEIGDRPKKVLSNPSKKVVLNPKRFYRSPFWPPKGFCRTPVKNHRKGSIEPFASTPPPLFSLPF